MDSLMKLSDIACQAERLQDNIAEERVVPAPISSSICPTVPKIPEDALMVRSCAISTAPSRPDATSISTTDRGAIRDKIKSAFRKKAETYDDLLNLCSCILEGEVFTNAPSKLDYYKAGISCCKRVFDVSNAQAMVLAQENKTTHEQSEDTAPRTVKRAKTQH